MGQERPGGQTQKSLPLSSVVPVLKNQKVDRDFDASALEELPAPGKMLNPWCLLAVEVGTLPLNRPQAGCTGTAAAAAPSCLYRWGLASLDTPANAPG